MAQHGLCDHSTRRSSTYQQFGWSAYRGPTGRGARNLDRCERRSRRRRRGDAREGRQKARWRCPRGLLRSQTSRGDFCGRRARPHGSWDQEVGASPLQEARGKRLPAKTRATPAGSSRERSCSDATQQPPRIGSEPAAHPRLQLRRERLVSCNFEASSTPSRRRFWAGHQTTRGPGSARDALRPLRRPGISAGLRQRGFGAPDCSRKLRSVTCRPDLPGTGQAGEERHPQKSGRPGARPALSDRQRFGDRAGIHGRASSEQGVCQEGLRRPHGHQLRG